MTGADPKLINDDLAPTPADKRTWTKWHIAALWVGMSVCIPTYLLAAGLVDQGFSLKMAVLSVALGNVVVLFPMVLNAHAGTKYGIPFPVLLRSSFGVLGANVPAIMRALVACGWFGINAWIGGFALHTFFATLVPGWSDRLGELHGFPVTQWLSFLLFWLLNIVIIYRGMELVRRVERWAAPFVLVMTAILVVWAIAAADGLGPIMASPGKLSDPGAFFAVFVPSLTATIGFWSTLSLNMPDFTRFGRSQREQAIGQIVALPSTMTVFAGMGILITSATVIIYGHAIADPIELGGMFGNRVIVGIVMFTVVIATLAVNIAANVVSPANDFANAFPNKIDFPRGGLITGVIGIAMMPWELIKDPQRYINGWLVGYSGSLGAVAGVLIVDYWIVRRCTLDLASLYVEDGAYRYRQGYHLKAIGATLAGALVALAGMFWEPLRPIYNWSWFVGFGLSGGLYWIVMRGAAVAGPQPTIPVPPIAHQR
jgi:NCS1 family nucleobase:cation symporter-1